MHWRILTFIALAQSAVPAAATALTARDVLSVPEITAYATSAGGDATWIERQVDGWNVLIARRPAYETRQLTHYSADDGRELFLLGFAADGAVLYRRGQWGLDPDYNIEPPPVRLLLTSESGESHVTVTDNEADAWTAPAVIGGGGRELFIATGGRVWTQAIKRGGERKLLFQVRGAVRSIVEAPDGQRLAFVSDRSIYQRGKYSFVGVFDRRTNTITYMQPGLGIDQDIAWSPDGQRVAFIRFGYEPRTWRFSNHREGAPFSIVVADAGSGEGHAVFTSAPGYGARFNGFDASAYSGLGGTNNLLWLTDDTLVFPYEKTGWKLLYGVPSGGGNARLLTPGEFEIAGATLTADRMRVLYWANDEKDRNRLDLYRVGAGKPPERIAIGKADDTIAAFAGQAVTSIDDDTVIAVTDSPRLPTRLIVRGTDNKPVQLSTGPSRAEDFLSVLSPPTVWHYESLDGEAMTAIVYRPRDIKGEEEHPVVVWAHGGSRQQIYPVWDSSHTRDAIWRYLVSRGYVVVVPNYRSGTGFGLDFREPESYGGRGAGEVQDFVAAAEQLRTEFPEIDPERVFIIGVSYGGHIATNALARSDVFTAGVSLAGVGDWVVEMEKDFEEPLQFNIPQRMKLEETAHRSSAISVIDDWGEEPILFVHGDNDGSAAMQQSLELYLALLRRGVPAEALVFPGEAHQFKKTENIRRYFRAVERFFDQVDH